MNDLSEQIDQKDRAITEITINELQSLDLPGLLESQTPFWYQSQIKGSAGDLVIKLIDAKLTASDEAFARSIISELRTGDLELRREAMLELGARTRSRRRAASTASAFAANRLTANFIDGFCMEDYSIDWAKLVSFVDNLAA